LNKAPDAFRTISEVADELDLPQHVLRFWESRFPHIRPMKRGGGRRYYRPEDIDLLRGIRHLLYGDGYTIRGVQRILREQGVRTVQSVGQGQAVNLPVPPQDDAQDADGEPNGIRTVLKFPSPLDSGASDETEGEFEEHEPDEPAPPEFAPQNRPMAEANSVAVAPVPRAPGAEQVLQASLPVAAPPAKGMAAEDLGRLKQALAELEACRRLLDKANEGGR
jgi:DNA-binding transcriptional MerR regulator